MNHGDWIDRRRRCRILGLPVPHLDRQLAEPGDPGRRPRGRGDRQRAGPDRGAGSAALDAAGDAAAWMRASAAGPTPRIDSPCPPTRDRLGGSPSWATQPPSAEDLGHPARPTARAGHHQLRVPHVRRTTARRGARPTPEASASSVRRGRPRSSSSARSTTPATCRRGSRATAGWTNTREARPDRAQPAHRERRVAHLHQQPHHDPRVGLDRRDVGLGLLALPVPLLDEQQHRPGLRAKLTGSSIHPERRHPHRAVPVVDPVGNASA